MFLSQDAKECHLAVLLVELGVLQAIARGKWAGPGGPRGGETIGQVTNIALLSASHGGVADCILCCCILL